MLNRTFLNLCVLFFVAIIYSCDNKTPMDMNQEVIIPKPSSLVATNSSFELNTSTVISYSENNDELSRIGNYLSAVIKPGSGFDLAVRAADAPFDENTIFLNLDAQRDLGSEGYELSITEEQLILSAVEPAGIFRGVQTLRQLLPSRMEMNTPQEGPWKIATGVITDHPVYAYRGAMLDVARHFFEVKDVKRYIDLLAAFKLNTLHLHLSDDQGWRIEIKSWPKLTEIGGSTEVGGGDGGFYTQEQYKDIVSYAADRYITIIPEIDMPGHTNAALASYPELNCDGKARELYTGIEVGFSTLCTDSEITYQFIDDLMRELAELTPGPYIHIGGDESHATPLEDYIPFVERTQQIVKKYGKQVMGWDEIANAELVENAVVQYWSEAKNARLGIEQGAKVLMSPATKTYLDMQYDSTTQLGLHWAAYIEVDEAYNWDPATIEPEIKRDNIIGVESPLWSETITNIDELEYMVFPRLLCHAEIGWTKAEDRNWAEFQNRLALFCERLEAMDIDYYQSEKVPWN
jgi:hexosaminidase